ncbi:unnamed protein product [Sphenostylis stenocarpa]|uniref:Uncharacterized protein n=1 Tax=Sphenostylis stenocarpa TaxID=92480 RepID=A0AA86VND9_9FABA|nr:unnamed protein product [Sphenostylis stenocarpa]
MIKKTGYFNQYGGALRRGGSVAIGWVVPHKAPPSGHKRPLPTHMRRAVLVFPDQDHSHTCSVRDRPTQLCINRKAGQHSRPKGVVTSNMSPLIPDMLWCPEVGRSRSSSYRHGATTTSETNLSTLQFI